MTIYERAKFEVALQDLAKANGLQLVEAPGFSYGPGGISVTPMSALWPVYDQNGNASDEFAVQFRPIP